MRTREPGLSPSRRQVVAGAAAMAGAAGSAISWPAYAQATPHRFKVGAAEVTVLSDGNMTAPLSFILPGRSEAEVAAAFKDAGKALGPITLQVNVTLIKLGSELILIDAGSGPDFAPARGKLPDNLEKAGINPEAITRVVFTHAHPDHLWGIIDPLDGGSLFPKARLHMPAAELDYQSYTAPLHSQI